VGRHGSELQRRNIGVGAHQSGCWFARRDWPLGEQHQHALAVALRGDKGGIELQRLIEVNDHMIGVVLGFVGAAALVVGDGIFGIEPDGPLVVGVARSQLPLLL
jgi:hypothetical protein